MPVLSVFYGIVVSMYFEKDGKHSEPHFHARYGEYRAEVDFNGDLLAGKLPARQAAYVKAVGIYTSGRIADKLELAMQNERPFRIDPLK